MSGGTKGSIVSATATGLALALIVLASGCQGRAGPIAGSSRPATTPTAAVPDGSVVVPAPGPTPAPRTIAGSGSSGNLATLAGQARSVETTAPVAGLTSVHLAGSSVLTATGDVVDRTGRDLGTGTLRVTGSDVVVTGPGIEMVTRLRIQPGLVTINNGALGGSTTLTLSGGSTINGANTTFQLPAPGAVSTVPAPATTVPPPVPVSGPVRVQPGTLQVSGAALRLVDAPTDFRLASAEADLSWAGSGSITTGSGVIQAGFLGVRAQELDAVVRRGTATVDVRGTGLALQAFADGVPQLRTPARVDVISTHATTGYLARRRAFVWTPRNLGSTYDMAVLRIRPGNAAAGSVHIGLAPMPPMFGGEPHARVGGDTSGLKSGDTVDSLIARNGDDKRSIGYDGPAGVKRVLVLEGNFDPIVVSVTTS